MLRDVFYYGDKPNAHPREKFAIDLDDARNQATTEHFWIINEYCDYRGFDWDFDFEFLPDEDVWAENHNNVWPSQHQKDSGTWLCPKEFSNISVYRQDVNIVKRKNIQHDKWVLFDKIDTSKFDFSWHPDPSDPPYIYRWGNKFVKGIYKPTIEYIVPDATDIKYMADNVELMPIWDHWKIPDYIDMDSFDFTWRPDPLEPNLIFQFGTQWQETGGPCYVMPGAKDVKYIDRKLLKAKKLPNTSNWKIPDNITIDINLLDLSWHPDDRSPIYTYQFGTLLDKNDGPIYYDKTNSVDKTVYLPRADIELDTTNKINVGKYYIQTTLEDLVRQHQGEVFWALNKNIDYSKFDFDWRPMIVEISWESDFVHVFGSPESITTHTYFVNSDSYLRGNTDFKFIEPTAIDSTSLSNLFIKPSVFFIDKGNIEAKSRYEKLKEKFPDIQKTRYLNTWVDTINRCVNRSTTELCWILNSELDYTDFDFNYYPNPWQMKMVHVFGTQWSHWGTTFMVNRNTFTNDTKYIKIIEHLNNLNFVKDTNKKAKLTDCLYDIFVIDHKNKECLDTIEYLKSKTKKFAGSVEYKENYLDTFKDILQHVENKKDNFIWICSSICDYKDFDFTYICDPFAREQLHVFPSGKQKYGDTFLVNVNKLTQLFDGMQTLKDYNKINFNNHQITKRYKAPEIIIENDTHTRNLNFEFNYPYIEIITNDNIDIEKIDYEPINLWSSDTKNIIVTSTGASRIILPKEAKDVVKNELYDYPYIIKNLKLSKSKPLDIIFLSNQEKCADENYEHLLSVTKGLKNRIVRVEGVNGRVNAYHAAANASDTSWFFTVFAKLKVNQYFDWDWQPDRLQVPKHYVFHAKNPVNGLIYGHQAMIAYNKKMTLNNKGRGLDFTQDDMHEVLSIDSGIAYFNIDEFTTWRTAFRECIKLCTYGDVTSNERLKVWTTIANGAYSNYCLHGANDAVEYFDSVAGDFDQLKLSYDWKWLYDYFKSKYLHT